MYVNPNFPVYFPSPCLFPNYISSWTWRGVPLKTTSVFFSLSKRGPVGEFCVCVFRAVVGICLDLRGCLFMSVYLRGALFVRMLLSLPSLACQRSTGDL